MEFRSSPSRASPMLGQYTALGNRIHYPARISESKDWEPNELKELSARL